MNKPSESPPGWARVDDLDAVRFGLVSRDRVYELCRQMRIRHVRVSKRTLLVATNFLEGIAEGPESAGSLLEKRASDDSTI
jgi:hypothetical protein